MEGFYAQRSIANDFEPLSSPPQRDEEECRGTNLCGLSWYRPVKCIDAFKLQGRVVERMREHLQSEIVITTITLAELWFGAHKSARSWRRGGRPTVVTHNLGEFVTVRR